ncbi:MAG: GYD domain-containing protein [Proteobacteria bacterium]|nr:GYD domain-containing protein [Pseudomonadota bacterium]
MPFYLYQCSYTPDAIKAMIAEPQDREAAASKMIESLGGKLHHFSFAFGTNDIVALIEVPDDKAMVAGAMLVARSGAISNGSTTKLVSMKDAMEAMALAAKAGGAYKPPTS